MPKYTTLAEELNALPPQSCSDPVRRSYAQTFARKTRFITIEISRAFGGTATSDIQTRTPTKFGIEYIEIGCQCSRWNDRNHRHSSR
jgi:hypothetical protein